MIEHKFFDLSTFKKIEDAATELDKLADYEGWLVVCTVGKRNGVLLLRRVIEYPQEMQQGPQRQPAQRQPARQPASRVAGKRKMFPDAVYQ